MIEVLEANHVTRDVVRTALQCTDEAVVGAYCTFWLSDWGDLDVRLTRLLAETLASHPWEDGFGTPARVEDICLAFIEEHTRSWQAFNRDVATCEFIAFIASRDSISFCWAGECFGKARQGEQTFFDVRPNSVEIPADPPFMFTKFVRLDQTDTADLRRELCDLDDGSIEIRIGNKPFAELDVFDLSDVRKTSDVQKLGNATVKRTRRDESTVVNAFDPCGLQVVIGS